VRGGTARGELVDSAGGWSFLFAEGIYLKWRASVERGWGACPFLIMALGAGRTWIVVVVDVVLVFRSMSLGLEVWEREMINRWLT
jgi:hypothetical protein